MRISREAGNLITLLGMDDATKSEVVKVVGNNPGCIIQTALSWEQRRKATMLVKLRFKRTRWAERSVREYSESVGTPPTLLELITRVTKGSYLTVGWISLTLVGYAILIRVGTWAYTFKCKIDKLTNLMEGKDDEKN